MRLPWDDYEQISQEPADYATWFKSDRNYDAWKYDALEDVLRRLKSGETIKCPVTGKILQPNKYILFEAPLGRKHQQTGQYIDTLIFVDIDPDIALARRILREYQSSKNIADVFDDLNNYLTSSRPLYVWSHEAKNDADIIVDGTMPIDMQVQLVVSNLK